MRSFSGIYFFMIFFAILTVALFHAVSEYIYVSQWSSIGIVLFISLLAMTTAKPYSKPYMNYMDGLLLSNYIILCYMLSSGVHTQLVSRILITTPIAVLIVVTTFGKIHAHVCKTFNCFRTARAPTTAGLTQCSTANTPINIITSIVSRTTDASSVCFVLCDMSDTV